MKPTKSEVRAFLENLQWKRMSKKQLEATLQGFLQTDNKLSEGTCEDCKDVDYSFLFTDEGESQSNGFIDVEIYYLKMRKRNHILITGAELLEYTH